MISPLAGGSPARAVQIWAYDPNFAAQLVGRVVKE